MKHLTNHESTVMSAHTPPQHSQAPHLLLKEEERQHCEVWTRVMGYHRPVSSFNTGKKGEHYERRFFKEEKSCH